VKTGSVRLKLVDPEHGNPFGDTCADAVTGKETMAPPHTLRINDSVICAEPPAARVLLVACAAKLFDASPTTESMIADVPPVFERVYTKSNSRLAQFEASTKLLNWLQATVDPPSLHWATAICAFGALWATMDELRIQRTQNKTLHYRYILTVTEQTGAFVGADVGFDVGAEVG